MTTFTTDTYFSPNIPPQEISAACKLSELVFGTTDPRFGENNWHEKLKQDGVLIVVREKGHSV